jgi:hypothetical protein
MADYDKSLNVDASTFKARQSQVNAMTARKFADDE